MKITLPTEQRIYQFDKSHASVVYKSDFAQATGLVMPSLEVMVIDAYRYQREFSVRYTWEPGDSSKLRWTWSIYRHPGRRNGGVVSQAVAERFIVRFLHLTEKYPALLFNEECAVSGRARCEGFVHMAEHLHNTGCLSVNLLK